jgi:hypothetical protein
MGGWMKLMRSDYICLSDISVGGIALVDLLTGRLRHSLKDFVGWQALVPPQSQ